jgi:hypothetical protein
MSTEQLDLFKSSDSKIRVMKQVIRTSIDLPRDLHRRLHEAAARKGCSARQLILASIERTVATQHVQRPRRRLSLDTPIVPSTGKAFDLTNEEIYEILADS